MLPDAPFKISIVKGASITLITLTSISLGTLSSNAAFFCQGGRSDFAAGRWPASDSRGSKGAS